MLKKLFTILSSIFFSLLINAQQTPASADMIMKEANAIAQKENKKVLIIFHASWCGWCHKMDTSLNDISVKKFFDDNFITRHMVVFESVGKKQLENPGAEDLLKKFNADKEGIPFWLIYDSDGNFLYDSRMPVYTNGTEKLQNTGCPASKEEVEYFITVLMKTTSLQPDELEQIRKRFRKNEL